MDSVFRNFEQLPMVLTVSELAQVLRISKSNAYFLMHSKDLATIRIGKRMLVTKIELMRYIEEHTGENREKY